MAQVKTYRNTHTEALKVGELEILPGELIPEAENWEIQNIRTLLRVNRLEVVYLDQETFDQEMAERNERLDYYPDDEEENQEEKTPEAPKKKVVRTRKSRGGTTDDEGSNNQLAEQNI